MISQAIYQRLLNDSSLSSLGGRIYPNDIPPEEPIVYPYLVYTIQKRTGSRTYTGNAQPYPCLVDLYIVSQSYDASESLGSAVFASLESQSWDVLDGSAVTARIQGAFFDDVLSNGVVQLGEASNRVYEENQTYLVWVQEL